MNAAMQTRAVIFDFDYTLADSSSGIILCMNHALRELGLPAADPDRIRQTIGLSLEDTLIALAGPEAAPQAAEFTRLYVERADEVVAGMTVVYDAVPAVFACLKERGIKLGIVTTKYRYRVEAVLGPAGLLDLLDVIIGGEDVACFKPDPEGLFAAMDALGVARDEVLYVGDSLTDAEAAARAGIRLVAVTSGVTPKEAFDGYRPMLLLDDVSQLPDALDGSQTQ